MTYRYITFFHLQTEVPENPQVTGMGNKKGADRQTARDRRVWVKSPSYRVQKQENKGMKQL